MELITTAFSKLASGVGPFFLLLGLLVFVHELGHFLVAIFFKVRVETFSLGFGKKLFSFKRGDTTYCVSLIPLGGYVKMYGDDPNAVIPEDQKPYSFLHKPVWPRIAIVLAGPLMNLLFAFIIFSVIGALGEDVAGNQAGDIEVHSPAYKAGFRSGDTIVAVDGTPVTQWKEVKEAIESHPEEKLGFEVIREGSSTPELVNAVPELGKNPFLFTTKREVGRIDGLSTDSLATMVGIDDPNSPAAKAGLKTFDVIDSINGTPVTYWRQLDKVFADHSESGEFLLSVTTYDQNDKKSTSHELRIPYSKRGAPESISEQLGIMRSDLFLSSIRPKSPAAVAGLLEGDLVKELDGKPVTNWQMVLDRVKSFTHDDSSIEFTISRQGERLKMSISPEKIDLPTEQGAMEKRYAIGVVPAILSAPNKAYVLKASNPLQAMIYGISQSWEWTKLISLSFVRLVQNEVSARNIGGVITIGRVASKSYEAGLVAFLKMMAIISINLFLLNLLPVPVLDGGHLVFFTIEALKGAPLSFKKLEIAQQVGLVLLLSLMLFALFNDITHLISSW